MKKANIVLDNKSSGLVILEKMDFEKVDDVFDSLYFAFEVDQAKENNKAEEVDPRFIGFWKLFLASVGWDEDDYWAEVKKRDEEMKVCPDCGEPMEEHDEEDEELPELSPHKHEVKPN